MCLLIQLTIFLTPYLRLTRSCEACWSLSGQMSHREEVAYPGHIAQVSHQAGAQGQSIAGVTRVWVPVLLCTHLSLFCRPDSLPCLR
jgi:hypothetical protein